MLTVGFLYATRAMLLPHATLRAIVAGEVDLVFRRWKRPTVRAGGTLKTRVGVLGIDAVDVVRQADITEAEAKRAGYASLSDLKEALRGREGATYRIRVHHTGDDPRIALRQQSKLTKQEIADITAKLEGYDARSSLGAWTAEVLTKIKEQPAVRAPDLAKQMGWETIPFKRNVRKLKALGLTESLEVGYRLSVRGEAFVKRYLK